MSITCPKCGLADQVQKVSAAYESGTQVMSGSVGGGVSGINLATGQVSVGAGYGEMSGVHQSALAQRLAPPDRPKSGMGDALFSLFLSLVLGVATAAVPLWPVGYAVDHFKPPAWLENIVATIFYITCVLAAGWWMRFFYRRSHKDRAEYDAACRQWHNTWLCRRCGITFVI